MASDINYLITRLSKIEGFGDTGEYLLNIVNSKKVDSPPPAVPEKDSSEAKGTDGTTNDDAANGQEAEKKDSDSN